MFRPLNNNVIIKKISDVEKNKYGIILSPGIENRERNDIGEVIAISEEINELEIGNKVIYAKYAGSTLKNQDEELLIINFDDILAVKED